MTETSPEIRRDVATVIDDLDFFPDPSVVEHLDLLARAHGIAEPDDVVDEVLEEVQVVRSPPVARHVVFRLASSARLATAFVRPRKFLILDEPEQRLDAEGLNWLAQRLGARHCGWSARHCARPRPSQCGRERVARLRVSEVHGCDAAAPTIIRHGHAGGGSDRARPGG
jgi:hypothetical protein